MGDLPNLASILKSLDQREQKALVVTNPEKRYSVFSQLNIDAMKLQVKYDAESPEEAQIVERRQRYGAYQRKIQQDANREVQEKYKDPFIIVKFDDIGALVRDQEAVQANFLLHLRYVQNQ